MSIPKFLIEKLKAQYDDNLVHEILLGYQSKPVTFRINRLKTTVEEVENFLQLKGISYQKTSWFEDAFIIENRVEDDIKSLSIYEDGKIYLQSLSSMLPVLFLDLQDGQSILDMAAAPGGKTTEIASLFQDQVLITAVEKNKIRADRLRYNITKQGVRRATVLESDASKLDDYFSFDSILLDAPCSGSGTLLSQNDNLYFKEELLEKTKRLQRELLRKAVQVLKPGASMIYSTCSILEEENEVPIENLLKENLVEVVPLDFSKIPDIPQLPSKISGAMVVMPSKLYEGFFIVKLRKRKQL